MGGLLFGLGVFGIVGYVVPWTLLFTVPVVLAIAIYLGAPVVLDALPVRRPASDWQLTAWIAIGLVAIVAAAYVVNAV